VNCPSLLFYLLGTFLYFIPEYKPKRIGLNNRRFFELNIPENLLGACALFLYAIGPDSAGFGFSKPVSETVA
jgi:hypothetical protein